MNSSIKINENTCPACATLLDAVNPIDKKVPIIPKPGDLSVCIYCTSYLQFDENHTLQLLSVEALLALPDEERLLLHRARKSLRKHNEEFKKLEELIGKNT